MSRKALSLALAGAALCGCALPRERRAPGAQARAVHSAPAQGALRLCGRLEASGRGFPIGFVSLLQDVRAWSGDDPLGGGVPHPGPTERSLVRMTQGRFCADGLAPGNYRILLSPPDNVLAPDLGLAALRTAHAGRPGPAADYRLSLDASGPRVCDSSGRLCRAEPTLRLVYLPDIPRQGGSRLEVTLRFPEAALLGIAPEPAFIFAQSQSTDPESSQGEYHFEWLDIVPGRQDQTFSLSVGTGRLTTLWVRASDFTPWSWRLPMHEAGVRMGARLEVLMGASGRITGSVRLPDGRPFRPALGPGGAGRSLFYLQTGTLWDDDIGQRAYADSEGRFESANARPGFVRLHPALEGDRFLWSLRPPSVGWVKPGKTLTLDVLLEEAVPVDLDPGNRWPPPFPETFPEEIVTFRMSLPQERWVVGLESGSLDPQKLARLLFNEEAPFAEYQNPRQEWLPRVYDRSGPLSPLTLRPGLYDFFLIETTDRFRSPSLRVRAVARGVRADPGSRVRVRFPDAEGPAPGRAELRGYFRLSRRPALKDILRIRSLAELHALAAPQVLVYDERERFVGAAFAAVAAEDLAELLELAEAGDARSIAEFFARQPTDFRLGGLAEGRYRIEARAFGHRPRTLTIVLQDGAPRPLAVDLDRRAPALDFRRFLGHTK